MLDLSRAFVVLFGLLVGHALADYPLQGEFLSKAKNHRTPVPGFPPTQMLFWHSLIHGGSVALVTVSVVLGALETACHMGIDWMKCDGRISVVTDQLLHGACKVVWVLVLFPHLL